MLLTVILFVNMMLPMMEASFSISSAFFLVTRSLSILVLTFLTASPEDVLLVAMCSECL